MATSDDLRLKAYVAGVLDGSVPSCRMERLAVERWCADLKRGDLYYDEAVFNRFCSFSRQFKHYKGAKAGQYFEPEFAAGNDILYVHFSRAMTVTFDAMDKAVARLKEKWGKSSKHTRPRAPRGSGFLVDNSSCLVFTPWRTDRPT